VIRAGDPRKLVLKNQIDELEQRIVELEIGSRFTAPGVPQTQ
jgi:hypothetical protein